MPQQGAAYDVMVNETRSVPLQGGREGYMGTYTDPATGDIITDVVSPRMPQQQQAPITVYPQVGSPYNPMPYGNEGCGNQNYGGQGNVWQKPARQHHERRIPNLPGNRVQHNGYSLPGGNPGNMGQYQPGQAGRRPR